MADQATEPRQPEVLEKPQPKPAPRGWRGFPRLLWSTIFKFFGDGCPGMAASSIASTVSFRSLC